MRSQWKYVRAGGLLAVLYGVVYLISNRLTFLLKIVPDSFLESSRDKTVGLLIVCALICVVCFLRMMYVYVRRDFIRASLFLGCVITSGFSTYNLWGLLH